MLTVATYLWTPDPGSKFTAPYTPDDVRLLQRMVSRHLTAPHEFAVITDRPELFADDAYIRAIPIDWATHVPGTCYVRLMTFHPDGREIFGADKLLQIDLDTLIVGSIDHLVSRDEDLVLWRNPARHPSRPGRSAYNTSILLHDLGRIPELWQAFVDMKKLGMTIPAKDDQWYLSDALGEDMPYFDGARDGVYRIAREDTPNSGVWGDLPANARIVTCPGSEGKADNPRVLAANKWIAEYRL
jgi:hypothetical protein